MTILQRTISSLFTLFIPVLLTAQPQVEVVMDVLNLGEVLYQQPKTVVFTLRNSGTKPLHLKDVQAACGCTSVEWSHSSIAPGETTDIKATFDAALLGTFQKEIEVFTDASTEPLYLTLQGRVVAEPSADNHSDFPIDLGTVRLSANTVEFDDVHVGEHLEAQLLVLNNSRQTYKPQLMHLPPYLTARYLPEQLAPGRVGRIQLRLNSERLKRYGFTQTQVYLSRKSGDKVSEQNEINISALLLPNFDHLSATERANAPRLSLSADSLDFGTISTKKKVTRTLTVTNDGQRPLVISSVQVRGKALNVNLSDRTIQPGRHAKLRVTLLADRLQKATTPLQIILIANDPEQPKRIIHCPLTILH